MNEVIFLKLVKIDLELKDENFLKKFEKYIGQ